MRFYNQIMLYFWLIAAVLIFVVITYLSISEGFKKWSYYYIFAGLALFAFLLRRWMMKRMEKHMKYLEEKQASEKK